MKNTMMDLTAIRQVTSKVYEIGDTATENSPECSREEKDQNKAEEGWPCKVC